MSAKIPWPSSAAAAWATATCWLAELQASGLSRLNWSARAIQTSTTRAHWDQAQERLGTRPKPLPSLEELACFRRRAGRRYMHARHTTTPSPEAMERGGTSCARNLSA